MITSNLWNAVLANQINIHTQKKHIHALLIFLRLTDMMKRIAMLMIGNLLM